MKPVFDKNGLATEPGDIRCYYYDPNIGEYTGWSDEYINIGVSMPGHSTDIDPGDEVAGQVAVFKNGAWGQEEDHRGEIVYSTTGGMPFTINYIGPVRDGYTTTMPSGPYDKWDGKAWVKDEAAEKSAQLRDAENQKNWFMQTANDNIAPLQDAVDLDIDTDEEKQQLLDWKKYRVLLNRVDTSTAPDIDWPKVPSN